MMVKKRSLLFLGFSLAIVTVICVNLAVYSHLSHEQRMFQEGAAMLEQLKDRVEVLEQHLAESSTPTKGKAGVHHQASASAGNREENVEVGAHHNTHSPETSIDHNIDQHQQRQQPKPGPSESSSEKPNPSSIDGFPPSAKRSKETLSPADVEEQEGGGETQQKKKKGDTCSSDLEAEVPTFSSASDYCLTTPVMNPPHFLVAQIFVRIYEADRAKFVKMDLVHWLGYYRYAGIQKVYLYDCWELPGESLRDFPEIAAAIDSGFLDYTDWHEESMQIVKADGSHNGKDHLNKVHVPAQNDVQRRVKGNARWIMFLDMDEYPFVPADTEPGFLPRYIDALERGEANMKPCSRSTELFLPNVLVQGERGDESLGPMMIQQVPRLGLTPYNDLVKQITRVDAVSKHDVHRSSMKFGQKKDLDFRELMMKHYWGGRGVLKHRRVDQLPETEREKLFAKTKQNDNAGIPEKVLQCLESDRARAK